MVRNPEYGDPVDGPPAWQEWRDERWYRVKSGHYQNRTGFLLHRAVWTAVHGPIPDGHDVHHYDHQPAHNGLANLRMLTVAAHRSEHMRDRDEFVANQTSAAARERAKRVWANRQPRDVACAGPGCDVVFQSTGMRARFHSRRCNAAYQRAASRAKHQL